MTQQHVCADAIHEAVVVGRTSVDGLHAAEGSLDDRERLVAAHHTLSAECIGREARADDIETVEDRFAVDAGLAARDGEGVVGDRDLEVLADLVAVQDLAHAYPDRVPAAQWPVGALCRGVDLREEDLGGVE